MQSTELHYLLPHLQAIYSTSQGSPFPLFLIAFFSLHTAQLHSFPRLNMNNTIATYNSGRGEVSTHDP